MQDQVTENASGADNQQERLAKARILRDYTPGTCYKAGEDIVRSPSRDGGPEKAAHEDVRNINERS